MDLIQIILIVASLLLGGVIVVATLWGTPTKSALSVLRRKLLGLSKTGLASGPELFSDDNARFMQLAHIFTDLVPRILLDVLTNHITSNKVFKGGFDNKPWDGGQEHREWLASVMEKNQGKKDFTSAAVRNKPASEWDVTNLSAALLAVMEPSGVPCDVDVKQLRSKTKQKPMEYFEVDVGKSERTDCKSWERFRINVTTFALPPNFVERVVECVVTEASSDTMVVAVVKEDANDRDLRNKMTEKNKICGVRPVNLPLPEVQNIVKVRESRNALYHRSKMEVSHDELEQCVTSVRHLIKQAFPKEDSNGYLDKLDIAADTEKFKEWITNGNNATEERKILEHMMEELKQSEQGEELRMEIEAFSEVLSKIETKLQDLQQRQEEILQGQNVIQCGQKQHILVTEGVMKCVQGLEQRQEYIYRQLELKGPNEGLTSGSKDKKQKFPYGSQLAQEYFESVIDTYSDMAITGDDPHVDYVGLKVSESHPSQHKKEDTVQFLRNFQKATVDFISQHDADDPHITQKDEATSGLLTHDHFLQEHKKRLHIVFGPPGAGKTSFSCQICSKFASNPQSSSHSLILLFHVRDKKVAEAKSLRELLSCYSLPGSDSAYDELAQLVETNRGRGVQIIFDGLDEHQGLLSDSTSIVSKLIKGELKEAQIMVTSRPGIVIQLSKLFNRATLYEVQGFGPEEVKEYVESYFCKEGDPSAASKFFSALANRPDLTGSTYIPLNLWLLCSVFSFNNCSLPDTLTQCYTILLAQLLQREAEKEGLGTTIRPTLEGLPESVQSMLNCLCHLAYQGFLNERLVFDEEMVINTCLASKAELKHNFDGMSLLHVHPKKHGVMDHLTFNFLHSTYQEYLCAKHIHGTSKEEQTAFWKENISNPRYAMVFRFYCGLSQLQIKGVQDIVNGQELPSKCDDEYRRLLFLFYALHESGNTHLTASIARQLDRALEFGLKMSSYDFYVTGHCLSKAGHLTKLDFWTDYTQETTDAISCIASVASSNSLVSLNLALAELPLLDAKRLTSALSALEELDLKLNASSGDAVEKVLFIPTLKKLNLTVVSCSDWHTSLYPKSQSGVTNLDLDLPSKGLIYSCSQMEELRIVCDSKDTGDVIAAHLPKCKNLRKVEVKSINPVPILLTARSCGKLAEVVIVNPKHCKVPADDGSEVSADLSARHLRRLELLEWSGVDSEVLKTCFSIVSRYSSLEELEVSCDTPDADDVLASHLPNWKNLRKVEVKDMNPVPMLLSTVSCGKLAEVVMVDPKHCKVPTGDGSEVSADLSAAHLRQLELRWTIGCGNSEVLKTCLSIVSKCSSLEELEVGCDTPDAGDIITSHLPKWKNLRKVIVMAMNPMPMLLSTVSCGKLAEVVIRGPKHCKVPTGDGSEVSADLSAAHLRRLELRWSIGRGDSEVVRTCLSIVSKCSSLEELDVWCDTPDAGNVIASHLPKWKNLRKVQVRNMNPVPMLLSTVSCGKLAEVVIKHPKHCKVPTGDGSVSVDLSAAHLRRLELGWNIGDDTEVLKTCLSIVSRCSSLEQLEVDCDTPDAGDVIASHLPKLKNLRKVAVGELNPMPILLSVRLCDKLDEVIISYPKRCKPTAEDWQAVAVTMASAQQLKKMELLRIDVPFLEACLPSLSSCPSLQELRVHSKDPNAGDVLASHLPKLKNLRKVAVGELNPIPILLSVRLCGKLDEVAISYPNQCKPTAEDWQAVAVTMASAQQLKKMVLWGIDVPFLEACLPSLSSCPSLQELRVYSKDPSAGQVLADNVLLLRGVETLSIRDINPIPVLQVLSRNANQSVSSMGISLEEQPDLLVGVSDLLSQCRTIRSFQLYLNKGPEALTALSHCLEGLCRSPSIEDVLICCLDAGAGPAVAQLLPNVVGRLLRFSVSLPDPTEVLSVLQDSSLDHFELVTPHMVHMAPHDQVRLRTLVSGVKCVQVSVVTQQEWQFPYDPWTDPDISLGPADTLCMCAGLSENPHIRGAEVSGVPPGLVSEVQRLLKTASCHSVTVNRETVRQVEPCTAPELELSPTLRVLPTGEFPSRSLLQSGRLGQGVLHKPTEEDQVPNELDLD